MLRAWVIAVVVTCGASRVSAEPDAKQVALKKFSEADKAYKRGEFENAAKLLRDAYDLYPEPILLYNLARALEGMGDTEGAILNYERFLDNAKTVEDRGAIERRLATLKEQLAAKEQASKPKPPDQPPVVVPPPIVVPPPHREPVQVDAPSSSLPPVATIALGGLAIGAGAYIGRLSRNEHDLAVSDPVQLEAQQHQDRARSYATTANITMAAGGAVVLGGLIWEIIVLRSHHRDSHVSLVPHAGGLGLAWEWP
jgi:tetratricopeptide (TPR) repeat protein